MCIDPGTQHPAKHVTEILAVPPPFHVSLTESQRPSGQYFRVEPVVVHNNSAAVRPRDVDADTNFYRNLRDCSLVHSSLYAHFGALAAQIWLYGIDTHGTVPCWDHPRRAPSHGPTQGVGGQMEDRSPRYRSENHVAEEIRCGKRHACT